MPAGRLSPSLRCLDKLAAHTCRRRSRRRLRATGRDQRHRPRPSRHQSLSFVASWWRGPGGSGVSAGGRPYSGCFGTSYPQRGCPSGVGAVSISWIERSAESRESELECLEARRHHIQRVFATFRLPRGCRKPATSQTVALAMCGRNHRPRELGVGAVALPGWDSKPWPSVGGCVDLRCASRLAWAPGGASGAVQVARCKWRGARGVVQEVWCKGCAARAVLVHAPRTW